MEGDFYWGVEEHLRVEGENKQEAKIILLEGAGFLLKNGEYLREVGILQVGFELGFPTKENFCQKNA